MDAFLCDVLHSVTMRQDAISIIRYSVAYPVCYGNTRINHATINRFHDIQNKTLIEIEIIPRRIVTQRNTTQENALVWARP